MRAHGLGLRSALGDATIHVRAVGDPAEAGKADVVLFAVKLWDTETAAALLKPVLAEDGVVVPFQNGVESIERIGAVLGAERVMGGVAYIAARIEAATGQKMPRTVLGEEDDIRKSIENIETPEGLSRATRQLRSLFNAFQWGPFAEAYDHLVLGEFLAEEYEVNK